LNKPSDERIAVKTERGPGVDTLCFSSQILSTDALGQLSSALESLAAQNPQNPVVLWSAHPEVFLAGAHLAEIADLDAESCVPYAHLGRRAIHLLGQYPAPTIAAVNGSCSGGGFDLVLACDVIVAGPRASFVHPGIRRGLITGWSGTTQLPHRLGSATSRTALLQARDIEAASAVDRLGVRQTLGDPIEEAIETARRLASLEPSRWRLWRGLRKPGFIDRFYASVVHKL
jgi:enoyl-CoA hydratase/carnithine racemase